MFYTVVVRGSEIQYPEHFVEKKDCDDRAGQLERYAASLGGEPKDWWLCYKGEEPYEAYLAHVAFSEAHAKDDPVMTQEALQAGMDNAASKAKTVSVLTAPPIDDSYPDAPCSKCGKSFRAVQSLCPHCGTTRPPKGVPS